MSRWLELAREVPENSDTSARHLTKPDKTPAKGHAAEFCPLLSNVKRQESEKQDAPPTAPATPAAQPPKQEASAPDGQGLTSDMRHGFALSGRPKTWTGNVVSLGDWRTLSEWEKHGPDGRHWNGITKQWEKPA